MYGSTVSICSVDIMYTVYVTMDVYDLYMIMCSYKVNCRCMDASIRSIHDMYVYCICMDASIWSIHDDTYVMYTVYVWMHLYDLYMMLCICNVCCVCMDASIWSVHDMYL